MAMTWHRRGTILALLRSCMPMGVVSVAPWQVQPQIQGLSDKALAMIPVSMMQ